MGERERLDQFRALLLHTLNIVRAMRKDTEELKVEVLALTGLVNVLHPNAPEALTQLRVEAKKTIASEKTDAAQQFEKLLEQAIGALDVDHKKGMN